ARRRGKGGQPGQAAALGERGVLDQIVGGIRRSRGRAGRPRCRRSGLRTTALRLLLTAAETHGSSSAGDREQREPEAERPRTPGIGTTLRSFPRPWRRGSIRRISPAHLSLLRSAIPLLKQFRAAVVPTLRVALTHPWWSAAVVANGLPVAAA